MTFWQVVEWAGSASALLSYFLLLEGKKNIALLMSSLSSGAFIALASHNDLYGFFILQIAYIIITLRQVFKR